MRRRMKALLLGTAMLLPLALSPIQSASAQFFGGIVYDPSNYAQNLLTAVRTLEMINNQIKQLVNEAQMIANQVKDLTNLPYTARAALNARLAEIDTLIKTAKGLAYDVASIDATFQTLYPEDYAAFSNAAMAGDARRHWQEASRAFHDAVIMQAKVTETIAADLGTLDEIVTQSESAIGDLQVSQAGNQLLALQTKQSMHTTELMAVNARADALDRARQLQMEERARIHRIRFIGDGIIYP
ncbi:MAG: P-type conjugative transfer protein TrbJ [Parvularculaceae bacterium]